MGWDGMGSDGKRLDGIGMVRNKMKEGWTDGWRDGGCAYMVPFRPEHVCATGSSMLVDYAAA